MRITFRRFSSVAKFGTYYFPLKIKILAKRERELTTKFAIARNGCWQLPFLFISNYFWFSFCFSLSVKCLFYSSGSLVHFGGCLFHFGGCLVYFGGCLFHFGVRLVHFGGCLVYFGGCLFHFGGSLVHFGGCLLHFSGRLIYFCGSLLHFGFRLVYFGGLCSAKVAANVPPLLVSCELRNELFSVKDKNSCETQT